MIMLVLILGLAASPGMATAIAYVTLYDILAVHVHKGEMQEALQNGII